MTSDKVVDGGRTDADGASAILSPGGDGGPGPSGGATSGPVGWDERDSWVLGGHRKSLGSWELGRVRGLRIQPWDDTATLAFGWVRLHSSSRRSRSTPWCIIGRLVRERILYTVNF